MRTTCPTTILALLLAVSASSLRAQAEPPEDPSHAIAKAIEATILPEVTSRLRSDRLPTVAWGAHIAARHRLAAAIPALRTKLRELAQLENAERRFTVLAVLDALIRTDATVTRAELEPFLTGHARTPALILLGRDPEGNRELFLRLYREHDANGRRSEWLAAGNLLAGAKADGFAALLLRSFEFELEVTVQDPGPVVFGRSGGAAGGGAFGDGKVVVPAGYPPTVLYRLTDDGEPGDRLFAAGHVPIYYRRIERSETEFGIGSRERRLAGERPELRVHWLAQLLDTQARWLGVEFLVRERIQWSGATSYRETVERARAAIAARFAELVKSCVAAAVLTEREAQALEPAIEVEVLDLRAEPREPLPELGNAPARD